MPALRLDRSLLDIVAWLRGRGWLTPVYGLVPKVWRAAALNKALSLGTGSLRFERTPAWSQHAEANGPVEQSSEVEGSQGPGVNLFGFLRGEFGLGEGARLYSRALIQGGFKVALNDINLEVAHGWNDRSMDPWITDQAPYSNTIIFVNPDFLAPVLEKIGSERLAGHRIIACWFWELEIIPQAWLPVFDMVDEIIVASTFVEMAFRKVTDKPILRVPLPLWAVPDSGLQRGDFGLEAGKFIFLCTFDFHSSIERKNPFGAISAFKLAFPAGRDDVRLLIKSSGGEQAPEQLRRLLDAVADDPRILVRNDLIARAHVQALQRCCDAYVSLHRAEGFGLGIAECMALGKPVIATGWSGNMDFMDVENSVPVDYVLSPIAPGDYPHSEGGRWADPDENSAAAAMVRLVDEPYFASKLSAKALVVKEKLCPAVVCGTIGAWLDRPRPHPERRMS